MSNWTYNTLLKLYLWHQYYWLLLLLQQQKKSDLTDYLNICGTYCIYLFFLNIIQRFQRIKVFIGLFVFNTFIFVPSLTKKWQLAPVNQVLSEVW